MDRKHVSRRKEPRQLDAIDEEREYEDALKIIKRLGSRRFVVDLAQALGEVSAVVRERGKGMRGKVSASFALENMGDRQIVVNESIKQSLPETISRGAVFYEQDGKLFDRDPLAPQFLYREVDRETGEIREPVDVPAAPPREV